MTVWFIKTILQKSGCPFVAFIFKKESMNYLLFKREPLKAMAYFDQFQDAILTRKVLDEKYGKGVYLTLHVEEAFGKYPQLTKVKH